MLRSLWAGVSGMQAHQIALDVEANNIANVNTAGFKYSRANFSDLLSQTAKIATAPQGALGGKNSMQIGLGTQISSVTKIFKQGSVQTTDKNTDLAIEGDGFFVVSPDGGNTYKYSRNGDFTFDGVGNFTDGNGYIIQGWMRDPDTNKVDSTTPIQNITIPPGLTTPANDTSFISLKANLNSGDKIINKSAIYSLDSNHGWVDTNGNGLQDSTELPHDENGIGTPDALFDVDRNMIERGEDFKSLFNTSGESFSLSSGQGAWVSYADSKYVSNSVSSTAATIPVSMTINGTQITGDITQSTSTVASDIKRDNMIGLQGLINQYTSQTGVAATVSGGSITLTNSNQLGTEEATKNIKVVADSTDGTGFIAAGSTLEVVTAFKYTYTDNSASQAINRTDARNFHTTEDLRNAMQTDARLKTDYKGNGWTNSAAIELNRNDGTKIIVNSAGQFEVTNATGDALNADDGDVVTALDPSGAAWTLTSANLTTSGAFETAPVGGYTTTLGNVLKNVTLGADTTLNDGAIYIINGFTYTAPAAGVTIPSGTYLNSISTPTNASTIPAGSTYVNTASAGAALNEDTSFPPTSILAAGGDTITLSGPATLPIGTTYTLNGVASVPNPSTSPQALVDGDVLTLTTLGVSSLTLPSGTTFSNTATTVNVGTNTLTINDNDINLTITGYSNATNKVSENTRFATTMKTLQGALPSGNNIRTSQAIYAASHASSIDVFDSLGSKHTVRLEFRKVGSTSDGGTQWNMIISVPQPGVINDVGFPENMITGQITFGSDGSLSAYSPPTIRYTPNNGSTPNQAISLDFGTASQFDGMTSYDSPSNTSGIYQDGFAGGDLDGIRVDETGTLIGTFTNGRSFGLAQVAMAKFSNNEGLESDGGNTFIQTSNSGDPIIGQASVGGRGSIRASALEMSNVDLSRSLTQLIIVQRGFQANAKTITTSDQILNTLLQLKQ